MLKSESIAALAAALAKAQAEIKGAVRDSSNPFFKSKYADLSSCVDAIREPFAKNGLSYMQCTGTSARDEVLVETVLLHSSGEWISTGFLSVPVNKADAQGYGSALTYARRYSLCLLGLAPLDDDGNAAAKAVPASAKSVALDVWDTLGEEEQKFLQEIADAALAYVEVGTTDKAVQFIKSKKLDADETTALWSRFNSQTRSALKKAASQLKEAA